MRLRLILCLTFTLTIVGLQAQTYFPPKSFSATWDTLSHQESGYCQEGIDSLYHYLEETNSKSLLILIDGKIALEHYFDDFTQDSLWYYASAGKSVVSFLLGMAQQEGVLEIDSPTSTYLGQYWTSCTPQQEGAITVRHQMAMSTGLDDQFKATPEYPDPFNCMDSGCLKYRTDPYDRWFYFNGPYRLTQDVLENATGINKSLYAFQKLNPTGWSGLFIDYLLFGRARDMARFGHLMLNNGVWDGDSIMTDQQFFQEMINSSQLLNPAYGLLWWLNGKDKFILPGTAIQFNGSLIPNAPNDMYAAMGKNEQRIYVIPSKKMVVVRQGNAAGVSVYAKSNFDDELWHYINMLNCTNSVGQLSQPNVKIYPNPAKDELHISGVHADQIEVWDLRGNLLLEGRGNRLDLPFLANGMYLVSIKSGDRTIHQKFSVLR